MTDQNSQFFAILTAVGEAKQANANALGVPWSFSQMGVGDANGTEPIPTRTQTKLINERRRAPLNQVAVDPKNPNIIIAEQVIPPDVGGWWIREISLYDADGDLVAVANCAPSFKPLLSQGTGKTQIVRLNIIVTSSANVQLKIDPSVVLATREYVDALFVNILPPNKVAGQFTKVEVNERGIFQRGFNPTTLDGYGISDALQIGKTVRQRPSLSAKDAGFGVTSGALEVREAQEVGGARRENEYAPGVLFHWSTITAKLLSMDAGGALRWGGYKVWDENTFDPATKANADDAYSKQGGLISGHISQAAGRQIYVAAVNDGPSASTAGILMTAGGVGDAVQAGLGVLSSGGSAKTVFVGLGATPWASGPGVRITSGGVHITGLASFADGISGDGSRLTNLSMPFASLTNTPTSLDGYNIPIASKAEAEAGTEPNKPMSALRVAQAILAKVVQATESVLGVARIATQAMVNAGIDDKTIVTPRTITFGFQILLAANGYVVFPKWLGGFVLQWGSVQFQGPGVGTFMYPIAFPNGVLRGWPTLGDSVAYDWSSKPLVSVLAPYGNPLSAQVQSTYATASSVTLFFIGH